LATDSRVVFISTLAYVRALLRRDREVLLRGEVVILRGAVRYYRVINPELQLFHGGTKLPDKLLPRS
jgi:hypothetical protein